MGKACENCKYLYLPWDGICEGPLNTACQHHEPLTHGVMILSGLVTEDYLVDLWSVTDFGGGYGQECEAHQRPCQYPAFTCDACPGAFRAWLGSPLTDSEWVRLEAYGELTECKRDAHGKLAEGGLA